MCPSGLLLQYCAFGPPDERVDKEVLTRFGDSEVRRNVGQDAIIVNVERLFGRSHRSKRELAISLISRLDAPSIRVVPLLLAGACDSDETVRQYSISVAGDYVSRHRSLWSEQSIEELDKLLLLGMRDASSKIRSVCVMASQSLLADRRGIREMVERLRSEDGDVLVRRLAEIVSREAMKR